MDSTRIATTKPEFFEVWIPRLIEMSDRLNLPTVPLTDMFEVRAFAMTFGCRDEKHFQTRMENSGVNPASIEGVPGTFFHAREVFEATMKLVTYGSNRNGKTKAARERRGKPPG